MRVLITGRFFTGDAQVSPGRRVKLLSKGGDVKVAVASGELKNSLQQVVN